MKLPVKDCYYDFNVRLPIYDINILNITNTKYKNGFDNRKY